MILLIKKAAMRLPALIVTIAAAGTTFSAPANAAPGPENSVWKLMQFVQGATNSILAGSRDYWNYPAKTPPGKDSTTWKLIMSFQGTLKDIQARNQEYWWVYVLLLLMIIGFFVFLYYSQRRSAGVSSGLGFLDSGLSKGKRALMRSSSVQQELYYAGALEETYKRANAINISGGGVLFATGEKYQQNDELKIVLELGPGEVLRLRARVVRIAENFSDGDQESYMLGVQFIGINKNEQDKIVKKIIRAQQGSIIEEKRKQNHECVFCGKTIPEWAGADAIYCPQCSAYEFKSNERQ